MAIREQDLETIGATYVTFDINQTDGVDDIVDADIGSAVTLTDNYAITIATDGSTIIGKLIALTLSDRDNGLREATVQVAGVMRLPIDETYPEVGNRVVGAGNGNVKQAPQLVGADPAGGNIARGTVIAVNGTSDCTLILN